MLFKRKKTFIMYMIELYYIKLYILISPLFRAGCRGEKITSLIGNMH